MSTFKGFVSEFPRIRIDFFSRLPGHPPPLACFLSHVHSDHLVGLESLRAPFVYCSAASREVSRVSPGVPPRKSLWCTHLLHKILLRLEKYHYRINFARGILESRNVTYDRSMRKLAKPLPLDTPTTIELAPGNTIQVTLIDANHCVGAVMFLIQGDDKAILYTGDIRAEPWWVNSLVQNPVLLPYTLGPRRLDCIYLDTTFATNAEPYREFPSKADGVRELLEKVSEYPDDTVFYFHSWTFGYENVWIALASFLQSRIHLDDYRARIYGALSNLDKASLRDAGLDVRSGNRELRESGMQIREAPALCGFRNGNRIQPGCLTSRSDVRIHSCERDMGCDVMDHDDGRIVHIIPIVTRIDGAEIGEIGAGGGKGDLDQKEELETGDAVDVGKLMQLCARSIEDEEVLSKVLALLQRSLNGGNATISLDMVLQKESQKSEDGPSLQSLVSALSTHASKSQEPEPALKRVIRFPYSRHSSYSELCGLVSAFRPKDVFPCTVDENAWTPEISMCSLFQSNCSERIFRHDTKMMQLYEAGLEQESNEKRLPESSQDQTQGSQGEARASTGAKRPKLDVSGEVQTKEHDPEPAPCSTPPDSSILPNEAETLIQRGRNDIQGDLIAPQQPEAAPIQQSDCNFELITVSALPVDDKSIPDRQSKDATTRSLRPAKKRMTNVQIAYQAALGIHLTWADYGGLVSTRSKADHEELEL